MPADLPERPDIAAMQATIPQPDPRSSTRLQAAAQMAVAQPYVEVGGSRFFISGEPDIFDLAEVGETINRAEEGDILPALGAANKILRRHLKDYPEFRAKFRETHGSSGTEANVGALSAVLEQFMEAVTARPTEPPAGSSAGPSSTSTTSRDASPSQARSDSTGGNDWEALTRG
jgi:hypothetical protein